MTGNNDNAMIRDVIDLVGFLCFISIIVMIVLWGNGYNIRPYHFLILAAFQFGLAIGRLRK